MKATQSSGRAFSLVELLAVLGVIALLTAFVVPAATSMLRGNAMDQATASVAGFLARARQAAITENLPVEVRLIQFRDVEAANTSGSSGDFRALAAYMISADGGFRQIGRIERLPQGVLINSDENMSSILKPLSSGSPKLHVASGGAPGNDPRKISERIPIASTYQYVAFAFRPSGAADLPFPHPQNVRGGWFLTLTPWNNPGNAAKPPSDYVLVQINPVSGNIKTTRP